MLPAADTFDPRNQRSPASPCPKVAPLHFSRNGLGKRSIYVSLSKDEWRAVAIAVGTGLRLSEQFNLSWEHMNEEGRTLTIPLSKSGNTRRAPISEDMMQLLQEQFSNSPWVFSDAFDPMQPQSPYPVQIDSQIGSRRRHY